MAEIELYKCICGTYVTEKFKLCDQCASKHGNELDDWPLWVRSLYHSVNFGGDLEYSDFDRFGRPFMIKAAPLGTARANKWEKDAPTVIPIKYGQRNCPACLTPIRANQRLCNKCLAAYGSNQTDWPLWLQTLVTNDQKAINNARNHREGSVDDETFARRQAPTRPGKAGGKISGSYGGRTIASVNQDNLSFDQVEYPYDDFEGSEDTEATPGSIAGDRSGHKYNAAVWRGSENQYNELGDFGERDNIENKIAAEQELDQWDPAAAAVLLLHEAGYSQSEISQFLKIRQQKVSEILRKAVKRG